MYKIAILYICTGKYDILWKDFYISAEKYLLVNSEKEYFVFTDADFIYDERNAKVHKIYQKSLGWPDNTLMRFHFFRQIEDRLISFDYLIFFNANYEFIKLIHEESFLPIKENLLVVQHPAFASTTRENFVYDRNIRSSAYISKDQGRVYVCGCLVGGKKDSFIELIHALCDNIDLDKKNGVVALWHDESHLNKYILNRDDYKMLMPNYAYVYTDLWNQELEPEMILREKSKYFNVGFVKPWVMMRSIVSILILKIRRYFRC